MRTARTIGMLVLGVWLLLWGLIQIITVTIPMEEIILGSLAIIGGLLLLLGL
jgi:hypothetical protein